MRASRRTTPCTNAVARPSLGRDLSDGNVTVNLIEPFTLFAERQNVIDFRVAKIFRFGRTRTPGRRRPLQRDEQRRRNGLHADVLDDEHGLAAADGDPPGAVRQDQRAVRLLDRLWASGFWLGTTEQGKPRPRSRKRAGLSFWGDSTSRSGSGLGLAVAQSLKPEAFTGFRLRASRGTGRRKSRPFSFLISLTSGNMERNLSDMPDPRPARVVV